MSVNLYVANGLFHTYQLVGSTFIGGNFSFSFHFLMKIMLTSKQNRLRFSAASHLGLFCLHMSLKKDARLIRINPQKQGFSRLK